MEPEAYVGQVLRNIASGENFAAFADVSKNLLDCLYTQAVTDYDKGDIVVALRKFGALCHMDHWNPRNFIGFGSCQKLIKNYAAAIDSFSYAVRLDVSNPIPFVYIGDCYLLLKKQRKARNAYKAAVVFSKEYELSNPEYDRAKSLIAHLK